MSLYHAVVTIHLLAAIFWLGGMFFTALVAAPVLRRVEPAELRSELFRRLGVSFRYAGWAAILLLIATGSSMLYLRGLLHVEVLTSGDFWRSPFGRALGEKLGVVAVMLTIALAHDFVFGPRAAAAVHGSRQARVWRRCSAWSARINAVLGVVLVIVAVRLVRGG